MADERIERMKSILAEMFAPWIHRLDITPGEITETGAVFTVPENAELMREGGIVCGQAVSAIADTVGVLTLVGHLDKFRMMTTVDMTTHFMRPVMAGEIEVVVTILSNGRRMATVRLDFRNTGNPKLCAGATCAYAYLDG